MARPKRPYPGDCRRGAAVPFPDPRGGQTRQPPNLLFCRTAQEPAARLTDRLVLSAVEPTGVFPSPSSAALNFIPDQLHQRETLAAAAMNQSLLHEKPSAAR